MGQIIGYTGTGGTDPVSPRIYSDLAFAPTLNSGQAINTINIKVGVTGSILLDVALYDVTDVVSDFSAAPRVALISDVAFTGTGNAAVDIQSSTFTEVDLSAFSGRNLSLVVNNLRVDGSASSASIVKRGVVTTGGRADTLSDPFGSALTSDRAALAWAETLAATSGPDYTQRKGSTFDATHTLGTITTATLNAAAITINTTGASTVNLTDTSGVTTSGVYNLVLGDGAATQTQTVQVNVFGVVPSNNPAQKDGLALASLTGVQIRITAGANLNGTQVYYSPTETTDASGNFSTLDVSPSAAVAADPVRMQVLTAAGDSITSAETVGLI
jgi:hypothetical protein